MLARLLLTAACLLCARAAFDPALACERAGFSVIERCGAHVGTGNLAAAAQYANEVIAAFPDCVDSYQCAGVVAYTLGDTKAAIVAFEKVRGGTVAMWHSCSQPPSVPPPCRLWV